MRLFDDISPSERRFKKYNEPLFDYYNTSGRPSVAALRDLLESWFEQYPDPWKPELRERFRSRTDSQHQSAFFELYLHRLLRCMGFDLDRHPDVSGSTGAHPDYLVRKGNEKFFYLEGTLALPSQDESAENARVTQVYDTLNEMESPNFFLAVRVSGGPATPPPGARLRRELEKWLSTLNPDVLGSVLALEGFDGLPCFEWSHEEWDVSFFPVAKSLGIRGHGGIRPIGMIMPEEFRIVENYKAIRAALASKATKYGELDLPFVVAVNVIDDFADNIDVMNGLLGEENVAARRRPDGTIEQTEGRNPNGAWFGPSGPRNRRVSAVLMLLKLTPWTLITLTPELIHNPWAKRPLPSQIWPLHQMIPNMINHRMEYKPGVTAAHFLGLLNPWPLPYED